MATEQTACEVTEQNKVNSNLSYTIDSNELEIVFGKVVSALGPRMLQISDSREKVKQLINIVCTSSSPVIGCKMYKESLLPDGTFDKSQKTVVITSYLNLRFLGIPKMNAKKVILSHHMRNKLSEVFDTVAQEDFSSTEKSKVLMFKNVNEQFGQKKVPAFIQKSPNDFVFLKVILKLPNVEK